MFNYTALLCSNGETLGTLHSLYPISGLYFSSSYIFGILFRPVLCPRCITSLSSERQISLQYSSSENLAGSVDLSLDGVLFSFPVIHYCQIEIQMFVVRRDDTDFRLHIRRLRYRVIAPDFKQQAHHTDKNTSVALNRATKRLKRERDHRHDYSRYLGGHLLRIWIS